MKKYVLIGVISGLFISALLFLLKKKKTRGMEFRDFINSPLTAEGLFGDAFEEVPDRI